MRANRNNPATRFGVRSIEAAAAEWLARRDRGFTPEEQDDYLEWLRGDASRPRTVARLEKAWADLDLLSEWRPEHASAPNPDLLARGRRGRFAWLVCGAALAAAAIALAFVVVAPNRSGSSHAPLAVVAREYQQRVLEDGSVIDLRSGAAVEVDYTAGERRVRLVRGEALFTVAKNRTRPFIVRAGTVDVRAIGTAFNIRLNQDVVEVLVTEGQVEVDEAKSAPFTAVTHEEGPQRSGLEEASPLVAAGHRAVIPIAPASGQPPVVAAISADEIERSLAWQPKRLEFTETPLGEVVDSFNRCNERRLRLGDPSLAGLRIGGNFRSDNLDAFVRLLTASFGIEADYDRDEIVLYRSK